MSSTNPIQNVIGSDNRLSWRSLSREGINIVFFLAGWYLLAGFLLVVGMIIRTGQGAGATLIGTLIIGIAAAIYFAGTFIALIRVLGKSIAYGISEADLSVSQSEKEPPQPSENVNE